MILIFHIFIALSSLAFTTYLFFRPSKTKIKVSYGLVALTLSSGTYLIWSTQGHLLEACMMGLIYVGLTSLGTVLASQKLAHETQSID